MFFLLGIYGFLPHPAPPLAPGAVPPRNGFFVLVHILNPGFHNFPDARGQGFLVFGSFPFNEKKGNCDFFVSKLFFKTYLLLFCVELDEVEAPSFLLFLFLTPEVILEVCSSPDSDLFFFLTGAATRAWSNDRPVKRGFVFHSRIKGEGFFQLHSPLLLGGVDVVDAYFTFGSCFLAWGRGGGRDFSCIHLADLGGRRGRKR